jgi:hypothetical protein
VGWSGAGKPTTHDHPILPFWRKKEAVRLGVRIADTKSFKRALYRVAKLVASKRFTRNFLRRIERLLLGRIEIKDINLPARRAGVSLGISVGQDYMNLLSAPLAFDGL